MLEVILKRDLTLSEIEIWENLIKWGLAQLDDDGIEKNFKRILPLIRFDYLQYLFIYNQVIVVELRREHKKEKVNFSMKRRDLQDKKIYVYDLP